MNVRWKTLITISLTSLCPVSALYYVAQKMMADSIASAERTQVQDDVQRFLNSISSELAVLDSTAHDWASWDDTYAFVANNNTDYIDSNLMDATFSNLKLNVMLFVSSQGQIVFGKGFDLAHQKEVAVSTSLTEHCNLNDELVNHESVGSSLTGLMLLSEGPFLVASSPILTSYDEGPIHGTLVIGRYFSEVRSYLSTVAGLPIDIRATNEVDMPLDFQIANSSLSVSSSFFTKPFNETLIGGYALTSDIYGAPVFIARISDSRDIHAMGQASLFYLLVAMIVWFSALFLTNGLVLERLVLRRLSRLSNDVTDIATSRGFVGRVRVDGNDEMSLLASKINQMLNTIQHSRKRLENYTEKLEERVEEKTRSLKESEEKLRSIFATSPDAVTATDLNGTIVEFSEQTCKLHGYSRSELVGMNAFGLIAKRDHQRAMENLRKTLREGMVESVEYSFVRKDGSEFPAELSATVLLDDSGKPVGFVAISRDVTKRKQTEQRLFKSERLAAIGELAGMIGHDLRNPLTGIAGAAYYLRVKCKPKMDSKELDMISTIEKCIDYSNKIINDLLDYSGDLRLELTETNPRMLLTNASTMLQVPVNIQLIDKTDEEPIIKVDTDKLHRVFINLMKNAFDAMPNGGKLIIKSQSRNGQVVISFSDTGIGMSKRAIDRVWTPLYTTKAKGMGFGLPICKRIVEAHRGQISISSVVRKGTTITITLPVSPRIATDIDIRVDYPESQRTIINRGS